MKHSDICYYNITLYVVVEQCTCATKFLYSTSQWSWWNTFQNSVQLNKNCSFHVEFLGFQYLHFHCSHCEAHHLHNCRTSKGLSHNYKQCNQFYNKPGIVLFIEDMKHTTSTAFLTVNTSLLFSFLISKRIIQTFHLLSEPFMNLIVSALKCVEGS